jgi:hypothetical protein
VVAVGVPVGQSDDPVAGPDQAGRLRLQQQGEGRLLGGVPGHEVEEVPLRQERDRLVPAGQPAEVGEPEVAVVGGDGQPVDHPQRQPGELRAQPELVEHGERGRVDRVAAEVAEEVAVLLQDDDLHPGPSEEQPQDGTGRAAPGDHTLHQLIVR